MGARFRAGHGWMRHLVCADYNGFSFGRFVKKKYPHLNGHNTDLLIGDIFKSDLDEVFPLIDEMQREKEHEDRARAQAVAVNS